MTMGVRIIYILIIFSWFTACSRTETEENNTFIPTEATSRNVVFLTENKIQQTISVFRQVDSGFVFIKTIPVTSNRTDTQLPIGNYQFLFASSYGDHTEMNIPIPGSTLFPEMKFSVLPDESNPTYTHEGDELFLQEGKVDSIYVINNSTTIHATLKRAVAQVIIHVNRGWHTGDGQYTSLPYQNDSIIRYFSQICLNIENIGTAVDAHGTSEGQGMLTVAIPAEARDHITGEGFAVYTGPFFFPAANGETVLLKLSLYRNEDSPQPNLSLTKQATVKRNEQLILTAWITSDWNIIDVTADTKTISCENEGEQGTWDDHITF